MIPSIETTVEDLAAGRITKSQAVSWLYAHAEGAANELRDIFAAAALKGYSANARVMNKAIDEWDDGKGPRPTCIAEFLAGLSYEVADAMLEARKAK